jgi:hypothetical protein
MGVGEFPTRVWTEDPITHIAGGVQYKYSRHRTSPRASREAEAGSATPLAKPVSRKADATSPRVGLSHVNAFLAAFRGWSTFFGGPLCR